MNKYLKKAMVKLPANALGGFIKLIPMEMHQSVPQDVFGQFLATNNDVINGQRSIGMINITPEFFNVQFNPTKSITGSIPVRVRQFILNHCKVQTIEPTNDTSTTGRYILVIDEADIPNAMMKLGELCHFMSSNKTMPSNIDSLRRFNGLPKVTNGQSRDTSVLKLAARIQAIAKVNSNTKRVKPVPRITPMHRTRVQ